MVDGKKVVEPGRRKGREATARAVLDAAKAVLAEDGFQAFGVNAIARRAGCDKQLLYRYFGGLEGLADAIGAELAVELTEELKPLSVGASPATYHELMRRLAMALFDLLRGNRLMQQINAWESAAPSPLARALAATRSQRMALWMHEMRGALAPPDDIDAPAVNAVIIAAIQQLVLAGAANGAFSGLPLQSEVDWKRAKAAILSVVDAIYAV
jgi:AcrR family transcriptional regulator